MESSSFTSVVRDMVIKASPVRVWQALTIPEERNRWETRSCILEMHIGGRVELDYGWGVSYTGVVKELVPGERLVLEDDHKDLTIWTVEPHPDGTLVRIEYTGLWSGELGLMMMKDMSYGTYRFLRNYRSVLEGGPDLRPGFWKSWIGVQQITLESAELTGVKVVRVVANSPADGLVQPGDIITFVDGEPVYDFDEFEEKITTLDPYEIVTLALVRDGKELSVDVETLPFGQKRTPASTAPEE